MNALVLCLRDKERNHHHTRISEEEAAEYVLGGFLKSMRPEHVRVNDEEEVIEAWIIYKQH